MTVSKYELQIKPFNITIYDTDVYGEDGDKPKIRVNGRNYGVAASAELPDSIIKAWDSLRGLVFSSEEEFLSEIEHTFSIIGASTCKKTYNIATEHLLSKTTFESESAKNFRKQTYQELITLNDIKEVLANSKCSLPIIFEIAKQIEKEGNIERARLIRQEARPFDLKASIESISHIIFENHYDHLKGMQYADYLLKEFNKGSYEQIYEDEELANRLTDELREVSQDFHFEVHVKRPNEEKNPLDEIKRLHETNFGFSEIKKIDNNICLLEINKMENPKQPLTKEKAISLIQEIKNLNPKAIIFDLRNNSGGSPYMSEIFCNYFNEGESERELCKYEYSKPIENEEKNFFPTEPCKISTYDKIPKENRILDKPIYILTSNMTVSAGEDFVCHFKEINKNNTRVTIIGETTKGASNLNKLFEAGVNFNVAVPIGGAIVPYKNYQRNWEGTGIKPHIEIKAEDALNKTIEIINK